MIMYHNCFPGKNQANKMYYIFNHNNHHNNNNKTTTILLYDVYFAKYIRNLEVKDCINI